MTYYIVQSLMWLLASFFVGACLGCILRNLFAVDADRRPAPGDLVTVGGAAAGAAATNTLRDQRIAEVDRVPQRPYEANPVPAPVAEPVPDDLKQIRAIGPDLEGRLHELGVTTYKEMAAWSSADVDRVSRELNINRRVSQENWIEQAAILAGGEDTVYSGRVERGNYQTIMGGAYDAVYDGDVVTPHVSHTPAEKVSQAENAASAGVGSLAGAVAGAGAAAGLASIVAENRSFADRPVADVVSDAATATDADKRDDLKRIEGIGTSVEQVLAEQGVTRYRQIAEWKQEDVQRFNEMLSSGDRIERENWIEQAAILANGGTTKFASRMDAGVAVAPLTKPAVERFDDAVVTQSEVEESMKAVEDGPIGLGDLAQLDVPESVEIPETVSDISDIPDQTDVGSDLSTIGDQVSESFPDRLGSAAGAAAATAVGTAGLGSLLGETQAEPQDTISETIREELEEARIEDGDAPDDDDAEEAREAYETMQEAVAEPAPAVQTEPSVTSADRSTGEAIADSAQAEPQGGVVPTRTRSLRSSTPDDLKRIRGIGVIVERKLNSMGVTTYEDIANWTPADIERVNAELDFMGRIERENWIEQARVLSGGGNTDFARRMDRGDNGRSPRGPREPRGVRGPRFGRS